MFLKALFTVLVLAVAHQSLAFEVVKGFEGQYRLTKAKKVGARLCPEKTEIHLTEIEENGKSISVLNLTARLLYPLIEGKRDFNEDDGCQIRQVYSWDASALKLRKEETTHCSNYKSNKIDLVQFNQKEQKLKLELFEDSKLVASCEWKKVK